MILAMSHDAGLQPMSTGNPRECRVSRCGPPDRKFLVSDERTPATTRGATVLLLAEIGDAALCGLLKPGGLAVIGVPSYEDIPGSYWGPPEAGLVGDRLYVRPDTPVHSALHEASHYLCMDAARRASLDRDAGGDFAEENAVCYLQILLAGLLPGVGSARMLADMDAWGYTFRLGSARRWFEDDAHDARQWLLDRALITPDGRPAWPGESPPPGGCPGHPP